MKATNEELIKKAQKESLASLEAKYAPIRFDDYIFQNAEMRKAFETMIKDGNIRGHILLQGDTGTGKSSMINIIKHEIVKKANASNKVIKDVIPIEYSVAGIAKMESLMFTKSKQKTIVIFEEFQYNAVAKSHSFIADLKRLAGTRQFQEKVAIIATSNTMIGFEQAILDRFHYSFKLDSVLTDYKLEQIIQRVMYIITNEYNVEDSPNTRNHLREWLIHFNHSSIRPILNKIQIYGGIPDVSEQFKKDDLARDRIVKSIKVVYNFIMSLTPKERMALTTGQRCSSSIMKKYNGFIELIYNILSENPNLIVLEILQLCIKDKSYSAIAQITFIKLANEYSRGNAMISNDFAILNIHNNLLRNIAFDTID